MDAVRTLTSCALLVVVLGEGSQIKRSSLVGHSIVLPCSVPHSAQAKIVWKDQVYSSTSHPIVIFQSENNPTFMIHGGHPNKANFKIDRSNFGLKISNLSFDSSGEYSCFSESGGHTSDVQYSLTVHEKQYCSGNTQLQEGQTTSLKCGLKYSGNIPTMKWHHETPIQTTSVDHSHLSEEGPVAAQELQLTATHEIDDQVFTCWMDFDDRNETCHLRFNVTFAVRDVTFNVLQKTAHVGDEVRCSARGNPRPDVSLVVPAEELPADLVDSSRIVIPKSWEGRELTLDCTANNTYRGKPRNTTKRTTFLVLAATTTTTLKPTPKPTEPVKPVVKDGENNVAGRRLSGSATLLFVAVSLTLRTALLSQRC